MPFMVQSVPEMLLHHRIEIRFSMVFRSMEMLPYGSSNELTAVATLLLYPFGTIEDEALGFFAL